MTHTALSDEFDAIVVGAGFAGLYMLHKLRGLGLQARVLEAGGGVGGTWYWNRYPGARCDIESLQYSYQFSDELQQDWEWTERYASQPEILRYLNHVADRFGLRSDIEFNQRVKSAIFDEGRHRWTVTTENGRTLGAQFCVMATGCLSAANKPDIKGRDTFRGKVYYTAQWPHEGADFTDLNVGVVGTGSSGVQVIPMIAQQAKQLYVFQRTPAYVVPTHNGPLAPEVQKMVKADYAGLRQRASTNPFAADLDMNEKSALQVDEAERQREFEKRWQQGGFNFIAAFSDLLFAKEANDAAVEFVRGKIRSIVKDPKVAATLSPGFAFGCKRMCIENGYYETFNRPNVTLVDLRKSPIEEITGDGIKTKDTRYGLDAIVFATGFDAMTGALTRIDVRGRGGRTLKEAWDEGPKTYLGLGVSGFPNLFTISGPGSPSVFSNMVTSIEQHVNWIANCIGYVREHKLGSIEAKPEAQQAWVAHVNQVADATLLTGCNSWYVGANVPGKARVFMPYLGFPPYVAKCNEVAAKGYEGFALS